MRTELQHPYAFLGHSFGATVAHEIAQLINRAGEAPPVRLIVSGARAPHLPVDMIHHLPEKEFLERLIRFEGVPPEVLENKEALALLLPKVRHDFRLFVEHERSRSEPLPVPISALGGLQDPYVSPASMLAWSAYTSKSFRSRFFPGNHFFLFDPRFPIVREICEDLGTSGLSDNDNEASAAPITPAGREQELHP